MQADRQQLRIDRVESKKLLDDFAAYCEDHPSERFWQAIRNWSGYNFILVSKINDGDFETQDTFYWKTRDGKEVRQ